MLAHPKRISECSVNSHSNMNNYKLGHHFKVFNEALKSEELKMTKKIKLNNN